MTRLSRRWRYVRPGDKRCPMQRLLEDCRSNPRREGGRDHIEVAYERQFQTLWKAARLGYVVEINGGYELTELGQAFIDKARGT